ncbi:hypothetical protein ACVOMV_37425 [Mesorhizobium atlanticum]
MGGIERKFLAQDHRARMGEGQPAVGDRDTDRLVAEIEPPASVLPSASRSGSSSIEIIPNSFP